MNEARFTFLRVAALAGGVGGARLAQGLAALLPPGNLRIVANTGDDFEIFGLNVCPDLDTLLYALAGVANPTTGWGRADDTFQCLGALADYGEDAWFRLGDKDFATHILRTELLKNGMTLTEATRRLCLALGVRHALLPMSDQAVRTRVLTDEGEMDFQTYFVRRSWQPKMLSLRWEGLETANASAQTLDALEWANLVVFCPSNPFVSIDPILNLPQVRGRVAARTALAVSPIIGGKAVKGPAAKMFAELGMQASAVQIATYYRDLLSGFVLDEVDAQSAGQIEALGLRTSVMPTLMPDRAARLDVARGVLAFGATLVEPCGT